MQPPSSNEPFLIDHEGVWCEVFTTSKNQSPAPALFLDRDGVIVEEVHYLYKPEECLLIPGAAETIARARALGWYVVVVTNQAGIARGYYGWAEFRAVQAKMLRDLAAEGAFVDAVFACPHHSDGIDDFRHPDHPARKPNPGMLLRAADSLPIRLNQSWIVGDRASDLGAGKNAGLIGGLHVGTGHGRREGEPEKALGEANSSYDVKRINSIANVAEAIPAWMPA